MGLLKLMSRSSSRHCRAWATSMGLSDSELYTALQLAADLANEQPIDTRVRSHAVCKQYLSHNKLLLGRASPNVDLRTLDFAGYHYKTVIEMQYHVNKFWRSCCHLPGLKLFLRSKWHT